MSIYLDDAAFRRQRSQVRIRRARHFPRKRSRESSGAHLELSANVARSRAENEPRAGKGAHHFAGHRHPCHVVEGLSRTMEREKVIWI